jgi:hypothetical protein
MQIENVDADEWRRMIISSKRAISKFCVEEMHDARSTVEAVAYGHLSCRESSEKWYWQYFRVGAV